jgi:hypothetical protein
MGTTRTHRRSIAFVAVVALVGLAGCGDDDDGGDLAAYCTASAELDAQESFPTDEQLDEIAELAPDEISDEVDTVVELLKEEGEAAYQGEEIEDLFAPIVDFDTENCTSTEGS